MKAADTLLALRYLIRDTFRQSLASGIFWIMLAVTGLCVLLCLSVQVDAAGEPAARVSLGFGAFPLDTGRNAADSLRLIQLALAGGVADSAGLLLALLWTSGFLPSFLEPSAAAVLLAKPVPRWSLLTGKYLGVIGFISLQALVFVVGSWAALGISTGLWDAHYLLCIPILIAHFAVFYSFSAFLAVYVRNAPTCLFGSVVFWAMCWAMNYARHVAVVRPEMKAVSPSFRILVDASYWILPKPADLSLLLYNALHADEHFGPLPVFEQAQNAGELFLGLSLVSSLTFGVVMLAMAAYQFVTTDY
jgi:ABC-type transport system involved in multi-copper enzyme maturation permease subunit